MARTVAVIGASTNRSKFGNKSVRAHARAGWTVYPVNPRADEIEALKCYASITDVPKGVDRISLYLPPAMTRDIIPDLAANGPGEVFFNPGADDPEVVAAAREAGLNVVTGCSIVDVGFSPAEFPDE